MLYRTATVSTVPVHIQCHTVRLMVLQCQCLFRAIQYRNLFYRACDYSEPNCTATGSTVALSIQCHTWQLLVLQCQCLFRAILYSYCFIVLMLIQSHTVQIMCLQCIFSAIRYRYWLYSVSTYSEIYITATGSTVPVHIQCHTVKLLVLQC